MTTLDADLALIGDRLQPAWRGDARRARRHRRSLLGAGLAALLALTGAAIASDELPINLTPTGGRPTTAALSDFRATYQPSTTALEPWQKSSHLDLGKAVVIASVTSPQTGPLSVFLVPAKHGACVDAARPDGSSYLGACTTAPVASGHGEYDLNVSVAGMTVHGVYHPPLGLSLHSAPLHAVRIDVRARDASKLPALISHGWLLFFNPQPTGAAVLVRVYDKRGKKLLSYYAP
jgi:hypothetical protein